jgi:hypothetical protein
MEEQPASVVSAVVVALILMAILASNFSVQAFYMLMQLLHVPAHIP